MSATSEEKTKKTKKQPPEGQQNFLFVDASNRGGSGKANNQNARAFVMQKARRERPWSTTKRVNVEGGSKAPTKAAKSKAAAKENTKRAQSKVPEPSSSPETSTRTPVLSSPTTSDSSSSSQLAVAKRDWSDLPGGQCNDCLFARIGGQYWCDNCNLMRSSPIPISKDAFFSGTLDPFSAFSIPLDSQNSSLLHHWIYAISPIGIPLDGQQRSTLFKDTVLNLAKDNPAAMSALCCSSVLHQFMVGRSSPWEVIRQKAKTIGEINNALSNPTTGVQDAVIWAVLNLAYIEESMLMPNAREIFPQQGDPLRPRMIHLMGIRSMIASRGGLSQLKQSRYLQAFLIWHVTAGVLTSFEAPYLTLETLAEVELPPIRIKEIPESESPFSESHPIATLIGVDPGLLLLAREFECYVSTIQDWYTNPHSETDPIDLQTHVCLHQCRITEWIRLDGPISAHPYINESFGIGLLAFISMATDSQDRPVKPMQLVGLKRLRAALRQVAASEWAGYPPVLLWILAIGAINAEDDEEFPFFLTNLRDACRIFAVSSFGHLLDQLRRIIWLDCRFDDSLFRVWEHVNNASTGQRASDSISEIPRFIGLPTSGRDRKRALSIDQLSEVGIEIDRSTHLQSDLSLFGSLALAMPTPSSGNQSLPSDLGSKDTSPPPFVWTQSIASDRGSKAPSPPPSDPWLSGITEDFTFPDDNNSFWNDPISNFDNTNYVDKDTSSQRLP